MSPVHPERRGPPDPQGDGPESAPPPGRADQSSASDPLCWRELCSDQPEAANGRAGASRTPNCGSLGVIAVFGNVGGGGDSAVSLPASVPTSRPGVELEARMFSNVLAMQLLAQSALMLLGPLKAHKVATNRRWSARGTASLFQPCPALTTSYVAQCHRGITASALLRASPRLFSHRFWRPPLHD